MIRSKHVSSDYHTPVLVSGRKGYDIQPIMPDLLILQGIPSLFLPYESDRANCGTRKSSILEVQAVAPPNARSWFIGEEVVAGEYSALFLMYNLL